MNTDTGRIYDLGELYPDPKKRAAQMEADLRACLPAELTTEVAWSDPAVELSVREAREELARACALDRAAMVSGEVAQTVRLGQRERERRARRRKAEKQARKRNR